MVLKGKVKVTEITHKNGRSLITGGTNVTESDVNGFIELVEKGFIKPDVATKKELDKRLKEGKSKKTPTPANEGNES